ncbi:MAG: DUF3486 family protein [Ruminococcus sp.]|nr:DUF3486 family protein [Ruminococcus sp.]
MIENKIEVFNSAEFGTVRTLETSDGKVLFCGKDIAKALGYSNVRDALLRHCKEKGVVKCDTLTKGGMQELTYIDEGNVYRLITYSRLPKAERFEVWVFDEVLPEIRSTGGYGKINLEEVIAKTVAVAVSETVKAIMLMLEKPASDIISDVYDPEPPSRRTHSIISRLDTELRTAVDDMILSRRYTYEEIKEFLAEQGVAVSMSSIQRYKTSLYRKG